MKSKYIMPIIIATLMLWIGMTETVYADTENLTEQQNTTVEESGENWDDDVPTTKSPEISSETDDETTPSEDNSEVTAPESTNIPSEERTTTTKNETVQDKTTVQGAPVTKPDKSTEYIKNQAPKSQKTVVTILDFHKKNKRKKKAKVFVYAQGKQKSTKTKIIVKIQRKVKGKWKKYKTIKKSKKSFYLYLEKNVRLNKKGRYRAVVTVYYYKKKKRIGKYKKVSKKIKIT